MAKFKNGLKRRKLKKNDDVLLLTKNANGDYVCHKTRVKNAAGKKIKLNRKNGAEIELNEDGLEPANTHELVEAIPAWFETNLTQSSFTKNSSTIVDVKLNQAMIDLITEHNLVSN